MISSLENSGSLTGHILSQGDPESPAPKMRTAKVVIIMTITLSVVVIVGLLVAILFRDTITQMMDGFLNI
jgi:hypothetical protein